jgi:hypothetical protein
MRLARRSVRKFMCAMGIGAVAIAACVSLADGSEYRTDAQRTHRGTQQWYQQPEVTVMNTGVTQTWTPPGTREPTMKAWPAIHAGSG